MRILLATIFTLIFGLMSFSAMAAQSRIPDKSLYEAMLAGNKATGWVVFQNEGGKQKIYFTPLASMLCGLKEIRFSRNSDVLDERFPLAKCIPQTPFVMSDPSPEAILRFYPAGSVKTISVQVVFTDGTESEIVKYEPCEDIGEGLCSWPLEN